MNDTCPTCGMSRNHGCRDSWHDGESCPTCGGTKERPGLIEGVTHLYNHACSDRFHKEDGRDWPEDDNVPVAPLSDDEVTKLWEHRLQADHLAALARAETAEAELARLQASAWGNVVQQRDEAEAEVRRLKAENERLREKTRSVWYLDKSGMRAVISSTQRDRDRWKAKAEWLAKWTATNGGPPGAPLFRDIPSGHVGVSEFSDSERQAQWLTAADNAIGGDK